MAKRLALTLFDNHKVPQEVIDLLFDTSLYSKHKTLRHYLVAEGFSFSVDELEKLITYVERQLYDQVFYLSHLVYFILQSSGDWTDVGEQQIKISFCRVLLQLKPSDVLTDEHASLFYEKVAENFTALGFDNMSLATAKSIHETKRLNLLGREFKYRPGVSISQLLRFLGSRQALMSNPFLKGFSYILAEALYKQKSEFMIGYFVKELMRAPTFVMPNVANVAEHYISMREEAFQTVFFQKWVPAFEPRMVYQFGPDADSFSRMSLAIKEKTLSLFGVQTADELMAVQKAFIGDMRETVLYHELGHGVTQDYLLPYENCAIAAGMESYLNAYTFDAIQEFLSDFSPEGKGMYGPMMNMINISKTNLVRASRMFYMYFSDVFFYDTDDQHMYDYSDIMCLIFIRYIKNDLSVDFEQMEKDVVYRLKDLEGPKPKNLSLLERISELWLFETDGIINRLKSIKYTLSAERDFNYVKGLWLESCQKYNKFISEKDHGFISSLWVNMLSYVDHFAKDESPKLRAEINKKSKMTLAKVMILTCGRATAEKYQFDARKYLIDKFKEVGLMSQR